MEGEKAAEHKTAKPEKRKAESPAAAKAAQPAKAQPAKAQPAEAQPAEAAPVKAEPEESPLKKRMTEKGQEPQPAKAEKNESEKAEKTKPEKAKSDQSKLPAPSKAAWNDVGYTLKKLAKAGKTELPEAWKKAQASGQQGKREFYYNVFLLDPEQSTKAVHKESLEKLTVESTTVKGWMTKWEIGKLQGADPSLKNFEALCGSACEGLPERDHENPAWAKQDIKQYWFEKEKPIEEKRSNESSTRAKQQVSLENEDFQRAEKALQVDQTNSQVMLGRKAAPKPVADKPEKAKEEPEEAYKKGLVSLQKAVKGFNGTIDKMQVLKSALEKKRISDSSLQLKAAAEELVQVLQKAEEDKSGFSSKLATFGPQLEKEDQLEELEAVKKEVEETSRSLNKAVGPHKLWAKNQGLI